MHGPLNVKLKLIGDGVEGWGYAWWI